MDKMRRLLLRAATMNQSGQVQVLGIVSIVPMGDWDAQTEYQKLNYVRHDGATYLAKAPNLNVEPGVSPNWEQYWMLSTLDGGEFQPDGTYPNVTVGRVINALYIGTKVFDGSESVTITAADLGLAGAYIPQGNLAFEDLPTPSADNLGYVWNMTDSFTTTNQFLEGAGQTYSAGANVGVVKSGESYFFDVLGSFIDLSNYATIAQLNTKYTKPATGIPATDLAEAVQAKLNSVGSNPTGVFTKVLTGNIQGHRVYISGVTFADVVGYNQLSTGDSVMGVVNVTTTDGTQPAGNYVGSFVVSGSPPSITLTGDVNTQVVRIPEGVFYLTYVNYSGGIDETSGVLTVSNVPASTINPSGARVGSQVCGIVSVSGVIYFAFFTVSSFTSSTGTYTLTAAASNYKALADATPPQQSGLVVVSTLPTPSAEEYAKHLLYLQGGNVSFLVQAGSSYTYKQIITTSDLTYS